MLIKNTGFSPNSLSNIYETRNAGGADAATSPSKTGSSFANALHQADSESNLEKTDKIEISRRPEKNPSILNDVKNKIKNEINKP